MLPPEGDKLRLIFRNRRYEIAGRKPFAPIVPNVDARDSFAMVPYKKIEVGKYKNRIKFHELNPGFCQRCGSRPVVRIAAQK